MDIFEVDTTTATPDEIRTTTQAYLLASNAQFSFRAAEIINLEGTLRLNQLIATVAAMAEPPIAGIESSLRALPGGYKGAVARVLTGRKKIEDALLRKAALDVYEAFELFLGDSLAVLFFAFPKFLTTAPENVVLPTTHYDDLYGPTSLLQARLLIARRKVAQLLQSENVFDLIKKTEQRFGVTVKSLSEDDRNALLELSARRNLWVHNAGIVNDIYLRLLRRYGVSAAFAVGAPAVIDETYVEMIRRLTIRAASAIAQEFFEEVPQIQLYHSKL